MCVCVCLCDAFFNVVFILGSVKPAVKTEDVIQSVLTGIRENKFSLKKLKINGFVKLSDQQKCVVCVCVCDRDGSSDTGGTKAAKGFCARAEETV